MGLCVRCGKDAEALLCAACLDAKPRISATATLILVNTLVFAVMVARGVSAFDPTPLELVRWGAEYGPLTLGTEPWRLVSAMFLHIGFLHLLMNMMCLLILGPTAETILGWGRFLAVYLVSGLAGDLVSIGAHSTGVGAGASGAIFGIAGALVALTYARHVPALAQARGRLSKMGVIGFVLYNLVNGLVHPGIDNFAHLGGLGAGYVMGLVLPVAGSHEQRAAARRSGFVLACTVILLGTSFIGLRVWRQPHAWVIQQPFTGALTPVAPMVAHTIADTVASLDRIGVERMGQERWQQSVDAFLQEIQLDTMNAMAWANLGDAYLHWDHVSDAIRPLTRATQLDSLAPNYPYLLGEAYMRLQNARLAVQAFGEALRRSPDNPLALFNRGLAYRALGDWDSARADLRRVAQAPPGSVAEDIQARARNSLAQMPPH